MDRILLSFCIPTYNRPQEIERLLQNLAPQMTGEVEIVIRDDSPNNETEGIVKKYLGDDRVKHQYFKGQKEGIDAANLFIASHAKGDYVWWCGDDDEVLPGAIERVAALIKSHKDLAFIFVNFTDGKSQGNTPLSQDQFFADADEFLKTVSINMTLLSSGIFRRDIALRALPIAEKYIGTSLASQPLLHEALTSGGKIYFLKGPYLLNHPTVLTKEGLFYDGVKTFGLGLFHIINEYRGKYSSRAIRRFLARNFGHIWRGLVMDWIQRDIKPPRNRLWELKLYWSYPEFWLAVFVFLMPKPVVIVLYRIYKKFVPHGYMER